MILPFRIRPQGTNSANRGVKWELLALFLFIKSFFPNGERRLTAPWVIKSECCVRLIDPFMQPGSFPQAEYA